MPFPSLTRTKMGLSWEMPLGFCKRKSKILRECQHLAEGSASHLLATIDIGQRIKHRLDNLLLRGHWKWSSLSVRGRNVLFAPQFVLTSGCWNVGPRAPKCIFVPTKLCTLYAICSDRWRQPKAGRAYLVFTCSLLQKNRGFTHENSCKCKTR